ncbi:MAG: ATP-binding protein [Lacunisphaera sp.]
MTIRTRLTLWYGGMLFCSLILMGGVLHYELISEIANGHAPETPAVKIEDVLVFYGLPTFIVLVIGGAWLIRRALYPVQILVETVERVHAGNLTERIPRLGHGDELDRLADVLNAMLGRIDAGIASVRDFTLRASHELKTPLTILSAEAELALGDSTISAVERARLTSQLEEIRRLANLVDGFGFLAKADAGLPIATQEVVYFDQMVRKAVEEWRILAAQREVAVQLVHCEDVCIHGSTSGLRQVLLNLLGNAVQHNYPGGWVRVALRAETSGVELSIENTGPQISDAILPRIFDRFVRGAETTDGTGLGLNITKTILDAHAAKITCDNCREGEVRFVVRFLRKVIPSNQRMD